MKVVIIAVLGISAACAAGEKAGYLRSENAAGIAHVWYPADTPEEPSARRYLPLPVSRKVRVVENAAAAAGPRPVILLSHGILGLATSYSWLACRLAEAGAVVLSAEHKGQSRADFTEAALLRFHERPRTLSAQLDWLLRDPRFAGAVDTARIFMVGHSVGGHSALLLAGARFDLEATLAAGRTQAVRNMLAGRMAREAEAHPPAQADLAANAAEYRDPRIKRFVLLDPVPVYPGFTDTSLKALSLPILYVGCSKSEIFDSDAAKASLRGLIPGFSEQETGAGHFVFAEEGTWVGRLLRPAVFKDPEGIDRARTHDQIYGWIAGFLELGSPVNAMKPTTEQAGIPGQNLP